MELKRILVPVDYSDNSRAALDYALDLAAHFGASIDVVHVWDRPSYATNELLVGHGPEKRSLGELIEENARKDMREFLDKVPASPTVPMQEVLVAGEPAHALIHQIDTGNYDLIVLSTHGRSGLLHLIMGSVAEKVVRHSRIPVLTVPLKRG